jgi:hypothetical protein
MAAWSLRYLTWCSKIMWVAIAAVFLMSVASISMSGFSTSRVVALDSTTSTIPQIAECGSGSPPPSNLCTTDSGVYFLCVDSMNMYQCQNATWVLLTLPSSSGAVIVEFVATGTGGSIWFSFDGITWTPVTNSPLLSTGTAVGYSPDLAQWLVGDASGIIATSSNGVVFTLATATIGDAITAIAWSSEQNLWVIGTQNAGMFYSFDGSAWTPTQNGPAQVTSIIYNARQRVWMATTTLDANNTVIFSLDGNVWSNNMTGSVFTFGGSSICASWNSYLMLAFGSGGASNVALSQVAFNMFSPVGSSFVSTENMTCAFGAENMFVIGGKRTVNATAIIGNNSIGSFGLVSLDGGNMVASRYLVPTTGVLASMSVFVVAPFPTGTLTLAVYSDTNLGYPGTLIATSAVTSLVGHGSQWVTLTPTNTQAASINTPSVWIVHYFSALGDTIAANNSVVVGGVSSVYLPFSSPILPLTWPTSPSSIVITSTFAQYMTLNTQSNLAYTTDGIRFFNIGAANLFNGGAVNSVAFNPVLSIWAAGGSGGFAHSFSGSSNWISSSSSTAVNAIAARFTSQQSPTSSSGVVALSGVDPLPPSGTLIQFFIGGESAYNASRICCVPPVTVGYETDALGILPFAGFAESVPLTRTTGIIYIPDESAWVFRYEHTPFSPPGTQLLIAQIPRSTDLAFASVYRVQGPLPSSGFANITSYTWSSSLQTLFFTTMFSVSPFPACYYRINPFTAYDGAVVPLLTNCSNILDISVFASAYSKQQGIWVVAGQGSVYNMAYSTDVTLVNNWVGFGPGGGGGHATSVTFVSWLPTWIIGTNVSSIYVTADPTSIPTLAVPFDSTEVRACAHNGLNLIVCAGTGPSTMSYSSNALTWTGLNTTVFSARGNAVNFNYNTRTWMAGGLDASTNNIATSIDGMTWIRRITPYVLNSTTLGAMTVASPFTDAQNPT